MNNNRKNIYRVAAYILIPIIYAAIGIFVVCSVFKPYIDTGLSIVNMLSVPVFESGSSSDTTRVLFDDSMLTQTLPSTEQGGIEDEPKENTVSGYDIPSPNEGEKYGVMELVSIGVKADLYYDDSAKVLEKGVGQYTGSYMPGNGKPILVAGHNNTYFHHIGKLKDGDIIKITTHYGVYEYKVTGHLLSTNTDKNAYDLGQDKEELILYTCYPFNTLGLTKQRWFVYAEKISGPQIVYR